MGPIRPLPPWDDDTAGASSRKEIRLRYQEEVPDDIGNRLEPDEKISSLIFPTRTLDYLTNQGLVGKVELKPLMVSHFCDVLTMDYEDSPILGALVERQGIRIYKPSEIVKPSSVFGAALASLIDSTEHELVAVTDYLSTLANRNKAFIRQETGTAIFRLPEENLETYFGGRFK